MAGKTSTASRATNRTATAEVAVAVSPQPTATGEDAIRARAFFLWQARRPVSDGVEFWLRAEQELVASR